MQEHEEELEECWECDGTGEVWENEDGETDVLPIDCPHCDGEGRTYRMTRDELIENLAAMAAGLQVPVSLGLPLGTAKEPWLALHSEVGFIGYHSAQDYEDTIRDILGWPDNTLTEDNTKEIS